MARLNKTHTHLHPGPSQRSRGSGAQVVRIALVLALAMASVAPTIQGVVYASEDDTPKICGCGCGNVTGRCCCTAPKATGLAFRCAQREAPNDASESVEGGKIIGPPELETLSYPAPAAAGSTTVARRSSVHGTICVSIVAGSPSSGSCSRSRHWLQLTRSRPVPSWIGYAEP